MPKQLLIDHRGTTITAQYCCMPFHWLKCVGINVFFHLHVVCSSYTENMWSFSKSYCLKSDPYHKKMWQADFFHFWAHYTKSPPPPSTCCRLIAWVWVRSSPNTRRALSPWCRSRTGAGPGRCCPAWHQPSQPPPPATWCSSPGTWWPRRCWCRPGKKHGGSTSMVPLCFQTHQVFMQWISSCFHTFGPKVRIMRSFVAPSW